MSLLTDFEQGMYRHMHDVQAFQPELILIVIPWLLPLGWTSQAMFMKRDQVDAFDTVKHTYRLPRVAVCDATTLQPVRPCLSTMRHSMAQLILTQEMPYNVTAVR